MHLRLVASIALLLVLGGCSSDDDDGPEIASESPIEGEEPMVAESEFVGRWVLAGYALDDGTSRSVPDGIRAGGEIGFDASSDGALAVQHDLCGSYTTSYSLDNGILTTTDPEFPDGSCDGMYADDDNVERSELLARAFENTSTMVAVSEDNVLTVTTGGNEALMFERVAELSAGRIRFDELVTGDLGLPDDQTFPQPRFQVLRDQESLDSLYSRLTSSCTDQCEPDPVPPVDFTNSIVVLVTHEIESTGGYGIEVTHVSRTGDLDGVSVDVLDTEPGRGCGVDATFSTPFVLYRLDTRTETIDFNERTRADASC